MKQALFQLLVVQPRIKTTQTPCFHGGLSPNGEDDGTQDKLAKHGVC